jgi:hypothetical protein
VPSLNSGSPSAVPLWNHDNVRGERILIRRKQTQPLRERFTVELEQC